MKKSQKSIVSSALSLFILAGNFPLASAAPFPCDTAPSSNPTADLLQDDSSLSTIYPVSTSSSIVDFDIIPSHSHQCTQTVDIRAYQPKEVPMPYPRFIRQQNPNETSTQCPEHVQPQVHTQNPSHASQSTSFTNQIQPKFVRMNETLPKPTTMQESSSTHETQPLSKFLRSAYANKDFKSPAECFKPVKNQESSPTAFSLIAKKKCLDPNISIKKMLDTEKCDISFDQAFANISNYIFDSSAPALKNYTTKEILDSQKNIFIKTKNSTYLEYVYYACSEYIKNYKCFEMDKHILKRFLDLSTALGNTEENACILILMYSQILKLEFPHDSTLSKSIQIVSKNVSEKLKKLYSLKLKNPSEYPNCVQHISRIYQNHKFYLAT